MKFVLFVFILFIYAKAFSVSLLQETQEIQCDNSSSSVLIEKKDKYFETGGKVYKSVEFLDLAILAKAEGETALIHMAPKSQAVLIKGTLLEFVESDCEQVEAHKVCRFSGRELTWAPSYLALDGKKLFVKHYGIYPNDGTYFIATDEVSGLAIVDFGSKVFLIEGEPEILTCKYL